MSTTYYSIVWGKIMDKKKIAVVINLILHLLFFFEPHVPANIVIVISYFRIGS